MKTPLSQDLKNELVVVYHRQPYEEVVENGQTVMREPRSPNGIIPAIKGFFSHVDKAVWVAWKKKAVAGKAPDFERRITVSDSYGNYDVVRLPLEAAKIHQFYHVTSKEALWPVIHTFPWLYSTENIQWSDFREVNRRFAEAGRLWKQAAPPYSDHWNKVMDELLALDFTIDPTFNIYEASRDLHRTRRLEWHEQYTLPSLWRFYMPSRISHGSYWHFWGTEEEVAWKENYRLWMTFVNEYKNRGGRVTAGSDSGFIYQLYGFAYIRELELLREAGFHPLEVVRSATLYGAEALGADGEIGTVEVGKLADFAIVEENPLANLKVLYGTGAIKLLPDNSVARVGGVKYTVKDGIVFDAKQLLADVREMVRQAKEEEGYEIRQPGVE